jgi:hypothetical protein
MKSVPDDETLEPLYYEAIQHHRSISEDLAYYNRLEEGSGGDQKGGKKGGKREKKSGFCGNISCSSSPGPGKSGGTRLPCYYHAASKGGCKNGKDCGFSHDSGANK